MQRQPGETGVWSVSRAVTANSSTQWFCPSKSTLGLPFPHYSLAQTVQGEDCHRGRQSLRGEWSHFNSYSYNTLTASPSLLLDITTLH